MLVYGKNVLHEIDKNSIKKAYVSRKDYIDFLEKNNIKYDLVDNYTLDRKVKGNHQGIVIEIYDYEYNKPPSDNPKSKWWIWVIIILIIIFVGFIIYIYLFKNKLTNNGSNNNYYDLNKVSGGLLDEKEN